ncbi:leucine-rich repeat-containing protein 69 isoform X3 [Alligator mississippiensis]|uniref:leucine-rich repeat-containing protein 69 isoform X3 n=1 Tax=Alligator mississippiensis TaxID=8496 RepID=UPI000906F8B0|nr:leucine-rich repeat-containing protein 69 isoform X3 [Alligator mississippiensis]
MSCGLGPACEEPGSSQQRSDPIQVLRMLTELNLGNNIFEEVPEQLKYLNSLQKLHLFGNKIATISPTIFDGLEKLTLLNLNNNRLKYLPPEIHRLENLEYMSLNNNQIGSIPKELCSLEKLSELHLSYNCLITVPEEIGYMTNLRMLCLSRNQIEVLPDGLCKLRKLRILDVAGNRIWVFPTLMEDLLLMGLKELYCEDNPLLQKQPVCAIQEEEMLSLTVQPKDPVPEPCENFEREPRSCQIPYEMTARFILRELNEKDSVLQTAVKQNQEVGKLLSKKCVCAVCGQAFLTTRLECVCFMHVKQNMKISRNIHLLPVRKLICSFQCFNLRDHGFFGVAES